jgi:hypothetical protein
MIVPDVERMVASRDDVKLMGWLNTLSQNQLTELKALNDGWWQQVEPSVKKTNVVGQVMADWVEEHGGTRDWWHAIELKEAEGVEV